MAAYTPAPWLWDGYTLRPQNPDYNRSDVHSILDAAGGYGFMGSDSRETLRELEADRTLIAAAPDLLEALKDALELVEALSVFEGDTVRSMRAAIAKATGQQP